MEIFEIFEILQIGSFWNFLNCKINKFSEFIQFVKQIGSFWNFLNCKINKFSEFIQFVKQIGSLWNFLNRKINKFSEFIQFVKLSKFRKFKKLRNSPPLIIYREIFQTDLSEFLGEGRVDLFENKWLMSLLERRRRRRGSWRRRRDAFTGGRHAVWRLEPIREPRRFRGLRPARRPPSGCCCSWYSD